MKEYELNYIKGHLEYNLNHDYIKVLFIADTLYVRYKWEFINIEHEFDWQFIANNDIIEISRICRRKIYEKVLNIINKE